jgi:hypothetical protein
MIVKQLNNGNVVVLSLFDFFLIAVFDSRRLRRSSSYLGLDNLNFYSKKSICIKNTCLLKCYFATFSREDAFKSLMSMSLVREDYLNDISPASKAVDCEVRGGSASRRILVCLAERPP